MRKRGFWFGLAILPGLVSAQSSNFGAGEVIASPAAAASAVFYTDIDSDGDADLLIGSQGDGTVALYQNVDGHFEMRQVIAVKPRARLFVTASDMDVDGYPEVLVASQGDGSVAWYANNRGVIGSENVVAHNFGVWLDHIFAADFNGDGFPDIAVTNSQHGIAWCPNIQGQSLGAAITIETSVDWGGRPCAGDIDGDGDVDLVMPLGINNEVIWWRNQGQGAFASRQIIHQQSFPWVTSAEIACVDVDGDGRVDVLRVSAELEPDWSNYPPLRWIVHSSKIAWHRSLGGGALGGEQIISLLPDYSEAMFERDFNLDGNPDVIVKVAGVGGTLFEGRGAAQFTAHPIFPASSSMPLSAGDTEGDRDLDLVFVTSRQVYLRENLCRSFGARYSAHARHVSAGGTAFPISEFAMALTGAGGAVVFGGEMSGSPSWRTMELVGSTWSQVYSVNNPIPRTRHAMVLDRTRGNCVMFGGANPAGSKLRDTWTYLHGQWSLLAPVNQPSARAGHAMAFDPYTDSVLIFGGESDSGAKLSDMWAWDGSDWRQISAAATPSARSGHGMAWDDVRGRMVMFGGHDGNALLSDVWEWDGATWQQIAPATPEWGPVPREGFASAFHPVADVFFVQGGASAGSRESDCWGWDGEDWIRFDVAGAAPSARRGHAVVFDETSGAARLFGGRGSTYFADLWEIDLPVSSRVTSMGSGCAGTSGVPTLGLQAGSPPPALGATCVIALAGSPGPANTTVLILGLSGERWSGGALPQDLSQIGMPGCRLFVSVDDALPMVGWPSTYPLAIPADPGLAGASLNAQAVIVDPGANFQGIIMSNGLRLRLGQF